MLFAAGCMGAPEPCASLLAMAAGLVPGLSPMDADNGRVPAVPAVAAVDRLRAGALVVWMRSVSSHGSYTKKMRVKTMQNRSIEVIDCPALLKAEGLGGMEGGYFESKPRSLPVVVGIG